MKLSIEKREELENQKKEILKEIEFAKGNLSHATKTAEQHFDRHYPDSPFMELGNNMSGMMAVMMASQMSSILNSLNSRLLVINALL